MFSPKVFYFVKKLKTAMNQISKYTYWLCAIALFYAAFSFYPKWNKGGSEATLGWDVCGYYYYLPALFIHNDLKHVAFHEALDKKYDYQGGTYYSSRVYEPTGNMVMKYTSGLAVMYAPAFFVAHILAKPLGMIKFAGQLLIEVNTTKRCENGIHFFKNKH